MWRCRILWLIAMVQQIDYFPLHILLMGLFGRNIWNTKFSKQLIKFSSGEQMNHLSDWRYSRGNLQNVWSNLNERLNAIFWRKSGDILRFQYFGRSFSFWGLYCNINIGTFPIAVGYNSRNGSNYFEKGYNLIELFKLYAFNKRIERTLVILRYLHGTSDRLHKDVVLQILTRYT